MCRLAFRMANLSYIRNFCFSHSSKDELSYCLSTFEAAVEYINLGKLQNSVRHKHTAVVAQQLLHCAGDHPCFFSCFCLLPQGSGELSDKALFKERMSLLTQGVATPINCLFEVSCSPRR